MAEPLEETAEAVMSNFATWLSKVDGMRRLRAEFVLSAEKILIANNIHEQLDLVGCTIDAIKRTSIPDGGMFGFLSRAVRKANQEVCSDVSVLAPGASVGFRVVLSVL